MAEEHVENDIYLTAQRHTMDDLYVEFITL